MWLGWLILLPISLLLHFVGWRRLPIITERIGHLAAEPDCFLKLQALGEIPPFKFFVLAPRHRLSNRAFAEHWKAHLRVIENRHACAVLSVMTCGWLMRHEVSPYVLTLSGSARYFQVNARWAGRSSILRLRPDEQRAGNEALRRLGIPDGAWFVCVHAREPGYSADDERVQDYRNVDIHTFIPAMQEIVRRGGWCIRMGHPSVQPLPHLEGVIDYARHPMRSAELDVFLSASCRFMLASTSGLFLMSTAFGVPCALTNMVPTAAMGFGASDLSIPKLLWSERDKRLLEFDEILRSPVAGFRMSSLFRDAGIEVVNNTAEEIEELTIEMIDRLEGQGTRYAEADALQDHFRSMLKPEHYCYGAASRIGARFLQRHRALLSARLP
jgi:putative glycosyltransferase (TIGR04372 family)